MESIDQSKSSYRMDNSKLPRSVLNEITALSNVKVETEEGNQYSFRDSIEFEEDLKNIMVDETYEVSEGKAKIENRFSFRDAIIFKEEFPINMDDNDTLQLQEVKKECLDMDIELLPVTPPSQTKHIEADLDYQQSFKSAIVFKDDLDELYEDHIFKEEIIIGPEVLQEVGFQRDADKSSVAKVNKNIAKSNKSVAKGNKNVIKVNNTKSHNKKHKHIYTCICGIKSPQKKWFDKHACTKNVFVCDYCEKRFDTKFLISEHMKIHQPIYQKCDRNSEALNKHKGKAQKMHMCNICDKGFSFISNLKRHLKIHLGTAKIYECDKCDKTYKTKEYLQFHIINNHLESNSLANPNRVACRYCSKMYTNRYQRNRHEKWICTSNSEKSTKKTISISRTMTCDICQKTYVHKQSLILHILSHMGKINTQTVQCDLCSRKFTSKRNLRYHLETHSKVIKYFCKICKKGYVRKPSLTRHERSCKHKRVWPKNDDKERKYECNLCANKYVGKTGLRLHIEGRHLGVKKFFCQYCKVNYSSKWWLDYHEKKCKNK